MQFMDKDLVSVQETRILMERANEARRKLMCTPQDKLDSAVDSMAAVALEHIEELAVLTVDETGYGSADEEALLIRTMLSRLLEAMRDKVYVGILRENGKEGDMTVGVPMGIAAILCPCTNSALAALYGAMISVKSGNAAVFAPHRRAQKTVARTVELLAAAAGREGCPEGMLACIENASDWGTSELIHHPETRVILNIGVSEYEETAAKSGKPVFSGATGPSPVFIDRTADVETAVEDIIYDRSFDGGVLPGAEQYVVSDCQAASKVREEMKRRGAYFMKPEEEARLINLLRPEGIDSDPEYMGKTAVWLAERAGFAVPEQIRVLVSEQAYISGRNPFAAALKCPVIAFYIEQDWMHACEKCMELLASGSGGHTLVIHSKDKIVIEQFALKKPVGRVLVNAPAALGALGMATECFPSMVLGGLTAGKGISAENITPRHLTYQREVKVRAKSYLKLSDNIKEINIISDNKIELYSKKETKGIIVDTQKQSVIEALRRISLELDK